MTEHHAHLCLNKLANLLGFKVCRLDSFDGIFYFCETPLSIWYCSKLYTTKDYDTSFIFARSYKQALTKILNKLKNNNKLY